MRDLLAPHSDRMLALCREVANTPLRAYLPGPWVMWGTWPWPRGSWGQEDWLEDLLARGRRLGWKPLGAWRAKGGQRQGG